MGHFLYKKTPPELSVGVHSFLLHIIYLSLKSHTERYKDKDQWQYECSAQDHFCPMEPRCLWDYKYHKYEYEY